MNNQNKIFNKIGFCVNLGANDIAILFENPLLVSF